ncbi:hypothetical protein INR49_020152 [Caranx melampygus]|nr:hypothetical protein INR49_020152 [Caranx melampygus]
MSVDGWSKQRLRSKNNTEFSVSRPSSFPWRQSTASERRYELSSRSGPWPDMQRAEGVSDPLEDNTQSSHEVKLNVTLKQKTGQKDKDTGAETKEKSRAQKTVLIVYAHQSPGSFNSAVRDVAVQELTEQGFGSSCPTFTP